MITHHTIHHQGAAHRSPFLFTTLLTSPHMHYKSTPLPGWQYARGWEVYHCLSPCDRCKNLIGLMERLPENIQACLRDFQTGTSSMARKRHLASTARGFYGFCLTAITGQLLHIALCCLEGSTMSNLVHRRRRCARIVLHTILCLEGSTPEDGCLSHYHG